LDPDPYLQSIGLAYEQSTILLFTQNTSGMGVLLFILILLSALISGSEVAFFSLSPTDIKQLEEDNTQTSKRIIRMRSEHKKLLATILISNNFVNIAIVIVSQLFLTQIISEEALVGMAELLNSWPLLNYFEPMQLAAAFHIIVTVVLVTSILVLLGEIVPKLYANSNNIQFAVLMIYPLEFFKIIFSIPSRILIKFTSGLEKHIVNSSLYQTGSTREDIDKAIDITISDKVHSRQDADILKGIVNFGDVSAKQVMTPRVDVASLELTQSYKDVMKLVKDSGFSRIPVYHEDLDQIEGLLYVKDLLGHSDESEDFNWQDLIRKQVHYVPEHKKIDDLLREFQSKRIHMAIVVNEYGGTMGIVTLEDIMEEVIGEIMDEFDEDNDIEYIKLDDHNFVFEGKTLLNDVCRVIGYKTGYFDNVKGNSDSLAGLVIEIVGRIPRVEKEVKVNGISLKVISATTRRIEKINLRIDDQQHD
jgi:putative hemolysin